MFGHADSCISEGESIGGFVGDDFNFEGGFVLGDVGVGEGSVPDFVEGIGCVGDELSEEDFFVGVEGVDDESHKLLYVCVEGKMFSLLSLAH